jgi:hypothetical protein
MEWDNVRGEKLPAPVAPPMLHLLETCWRLKAPSGRVVSCGIYRTEGPGVEVSAGFSDEDLLRSQRTAEIGSARETAEEWRQAVIAKGGFTNLPPGRPKHQ